MRLTALSLFTEDEMTHGELCVRAGRWLKGTKRCNPVYTERNPFTVRESPDAIGWTAHESFLVECKVSESDFRADARKPFRRFPYLGMGQHRYYMCPPGIILEEELPERWGLLYVYPARVKVVRFAERWPASKTAMQSERNFLRAQIANEHAGFAGGGRLP